MHNKPYVKLAVMALLSFAAMYILMYSMVNTAGNVYASLNQAYMAAVMAAPMVVIELLVMRAMYPSAQMNALLIAMSIVIGVVAFVFIRQQTGIGDRQFLRSMIPHHSGAILMCRQADVRDDEIRKLCDSIIASQQMEIDQMTAILQRLR